MSTTSGKLVVITGPSGVGKGTLLRKFLAKYPDTYFSVSATTRAPRPGEIDGQDYYFVSTDKFQAMIQANELLEWAEFAGNFYGTPREPVVTQVAASRLVILEIELAGARQVRTTYPQACQIFIAPPSLAELERRIRLRGQDSEPAISRRLERAKIELEAAHEFDYQIINEDLEIALRGLEAIVC
ncbi:guanylate kinase [Synechococcus sp. PCC 6312]|uniref:guanylate kinase n=1 Tax=Synechococcus sp. (strain ATCC 27167 / PCC 6312) TaxID=195253 RepID=UPI00029F0533|nr:guanylate kinase [Synechococcus sp. PCC 6312]AFY60002.1 guanylate kinase [Synechococcus sp. PCC 6312]